jgi:hypothetical protein
VVRFLFGIGLGAFAFAQSTAAMSVPHRSETPNYHEDGNATAMLVQYRPGVGYRGQFNANSFRSNVTTNRNVNVNTNRNVNVNRNANVNVTTYGGNYGPNWGGVAAGVVVGAGIGVAATAAATAAAYLPPPPYPYVYPPPY